MRIKRPFTAVLLGCSAVLAAAQAPPAKPRPAPGASPSRPAATPAPSGDAAPGAIAPGVIPPAAVPPGMIPPGAVPPGATPPPAEAEPEQNATLPPPSSAAQKVYSAAQPDLLQIRMVLKSGGSQSTVGSGFLVGTGNLVLTNYHVVSQLALDPAAYSGEYVDTDGNTGPIELLAVDVLHDLAVVRVDRFGSGFFQIPDKSILTQGQYLYSLGNPLDLGFAISEGAYNGIVTRSFYDHLMFTGPINAGMSGGPSVTADGAVAGVNVSRRRDGELVSFLVPIRYGRELLDKVAAQARAPQDFNPLIAQQLLTHQRGMIDRLLDRPLSLKLMGPYRVPVRESGQVRCWGRSNEQALSSYSADTIACSMESAIFVSETQQTGHVSMVHHYIRTASLDPVRFAVMASNVFKADKLGSARDARLTEPKCTESFVSTNTLPLRAVTCVRAYRKFAGLYNFTLLTASTDDAYASLQSRLDVTGVSYANGLRTTRAFLSALGRGGKR